VNALNDAFVSLDVLNASFRASLDTVSRVSTYRSPRRAQAAAETRAAILDAAENLFAANGYAKTTVAQIAAAADVAANTVYTSLGGKPQLVVTLSERAAADPVIATTLDSIETLTDGPGIIRRLAAGTGEMRRKQLPSITVMLDNVTADPLIARVAEDILKLVRDRVDRVAARLAGQGLLRAGVTAARAGDVLWFYFGIAPWRELHDLGWSWDEAEAWLAEQAIGALLDA
jgi:AcrR family transcriptional regulator